MPAATSPARERYLAWLADDVERVAEVLRSGQLDRPVRGCPGWTTLDVVAHLAATHRWAHRSIVTAAPADEPEPPREPAVLAAWFAEGAAALLELLRTTDPDTPTWTFGPRPRTVAFWVRRQAHETAMHRWDAEDSQGAAAHLDPELAGDGLAEVVEVFIPRQLRLGRMAPLAAAVRLEPTDAGAPLLLPAADPDAAPVATVSGTAEALLLLLWGRAEPATLSVTGDAAAVRAALAVALTP